MESLGLPLPRAQAESRVPAPGFFHLEENEQLEACRIAIVSLSDNPAAPAAADIRELQLEALPGIQTVRRQRL